MTAKIEPWIECAVWEIDSRCLETGAFFNRNQAANIIAAHAPKQEPLSKSVHKRLIAQGAIDPSVPVRTLKAYRDKICRRWLEINLPETSIALSVIGDELLQLIDQAKPSA